MPIPVTLAPLRYNESPAVRDPTGEGLLDRSVLPYRVWVPRERILVLGNSQEAEKELNAEAALSDRIPVFRRMSGGGAVLLSPGCLCVGLRFAKRKQLAIQHYFAKGYGLIRTVAGEKLGLELRQQGISDMACGDRKVAGCALYMPRDFVLYLASIIIHPDFADMEKYLAHPSKEPDYRGGRLHRDFMTGLASLAETPVAAAEMVPWFEDAIESSLGEDLDWEHSRR